MIGEFLGIAMGIAIKTVAYAMIITACGRYLGWW